MKTQWFTGAKILLNNNHRGATLCLPWEVGKQRHKCILHWWREQKVHSSTWMFTQFTHFPHSFPRCIPSLHGRVSWTGIFCWPDKSKWCRCGGECWNVVQHFGWWWAGCIQCHHRWNDSGRGDHNQEGEWTRYHMFQTSESCKLL